MMNLINANFDTKQQKGEYLSAVFFYRIVELLTECNLIPRGKGNYSFFLTNAMKKTILKQNFEQLDISIELVENKSDEEKQNKVNDQVEAAIVKNMYKLFLVGRKYWRCKSFHHGM